MKKIIPLSLLLSATLFTSSAMAYDGQITFTGKVVATTCALAEGEAQKTVNLPTVSASSFSQAGSTAGLTPFQIKLQGCPTSNSSENPASVTVYFEGTHDIVDQATGNLINTAKNGTQEIAKSVQIQILDKNQKAIDLRKDILSLDAQKDPELVYEEIKGESTPVLSYYAQYYAPQANSVTAGNVEATIKYTLVYK